MRKIFLYFVFLILFIFVGVKSAFATCSVSISPQQSQINTTRDFVFTVSNTGDSPIVFVKIPTDFNSNASVSNVSASGWDLSLVAGGYGMVGGNISAGSSANFNVSVSLGSEVGSISWNLEAAEQADGGNAFGCDVASIDVVLETNEQAEVPTPTPTAVPVPRISNIAVSASDTTATLTWSLDTAASGVVYYGTTSSYGNSVNTGAQGYEKATLTGLTPATTYHFQIQIIGVSGTTVVADNTFVTAAAGAVSTVTTTVTNVVTNTVTSTVTNTNTVTKTITDLVAPVLSINKLEKKVWSSAPLISGTASDNRGVSWVEYRQKTIGQWSRVVIDGKAGEKKIYWEVLPEISLDGTYVLEFRAVDIFGNKSKIQTVDFVIDQIPPTVGGMTVIQSDMRMPSKDGVVSVIEGTKLEIHFYERGGSERVLVSVGEQKIIASKSFGSNIWIARVLDLKAGRYETEFEAVDGAGRVSIKKGVVLEVVNESVVRIGNAGTKAKIKTYFWDSEQKRFRIWVGETFGQKSEIETDEGGKFDLILPKGKYYLDVDVGGYRLLTPTFEIEKNEPLSGTFETEKLSWWNKFVPSVAKMTRVRVNVKEVKQNLNLAQMGIVGRPKIVLLLTAEMPDSQLALDKYKVQAISENRELVVVGVQSDIDATANTAEDKDVVFKSDILGEWLTVTNSLVLPRALWVDDFGNVEKTQETLY